MNKVLILGLKMLGKLFGQDALFEAFKEVSERRTKVKLVKLDEKKELREIRNDIKEERAKKKLKKKRNENE